MQDFVQRLCELMTTPEERARHEAEREEERARRVRKRLYKELAKKGLTPEEVDAEHRRLMELIKRGSG